ncbi:Josephin-domain-containing protein [Abortiporus biennis]|nr:Josephin-domain-containing protein [Abortiporus biennis]
MASLESLIPLIYHEKQQPGSMLCAQHALNNLLQGNYFTAPDLSDIAKSLDTLEEDYDEDRRNRHSTNMDDTGFFSVQVLERALQVWGLTLVAWQSEAMRPVHDHPQTQMAFILNSQQHWYTLRRFGRVSPDPDPSKDPGEGHWFNLNSSLPAPERVGKLYLGMVLQQAESEGYSVFAVVQLDAHGPLALPRTEADELAASIPESTASSIRPRTQTLPGSSSASGMDEFEDEDFELQAALQASLMGESGLGSSGSGSHTQRSSTTSAAVRSPVTATARSFSVPITSPGESSGTRTPMQSVWRGRNERVASPEPQYGNDDDDDDIEMLASPPSRFPSSSAFTSIRPPRRATRQPDPEPLDPVEESRRRSAAYMQHVLRQQEEAMREQYEEEMRRVEMGLPTRRRTRRDEEDEELMRAIAESRALAEAEGHGQLEDNDDEEPVSGQETPPVIPPPLTHLGEDQHRVYDDDDAALQAALKASLETVPEGFKIPETPPRPQPPPLQQQPASTSQPQVQPAPQVESSDSMETDDTASSDAESSIIADEAPEVSMEEMRKRRLAKFGIGG